MEPHPSLPSSSISLFSLSRPTAPRASALSFYYRHRAVVFCFIITGVAAVAPLSYLLLQRTSSLTTERAGRKEGRKGIAINYQCLVTSRALEHALRCYCHPLLFLLLNRNANYYFSSNKGKHCFDSSNGKREREETIDIEINGRRISWTNRGG